MPKSTKFMRHPLSPRFLPPGREGEGRGGEGKISIVFVQNSFDINNRLDI